MNYFFLLFSIGFTTSLQAQMVTAAVIELPESQVIYRGIENKINISVINLQSKEISVYGKSAQVTYVEGAEYTVRPLGRSKSPMVGVTCKDGDSTIEIGRKYFTVLNLPDPKLYFGGKSESSFVDNEARSLTAKYSKQIPIDAEFSITRWTLYCGTEKISGTGSDLSEADEFLKSIAKNSVLSVKATVLGPDGIQRRITGCWFVN